MAFNRNPRKIEFSSFGTRLPVQAALGVGELKPTDTSPEIKDIADKIYSDHNPLLAGDILSWNIQELGTADNNGFKLEEKKDGYEARINRVADLIKEMVNEPKNHPITLVCLQEVPDEKSEAWNVLNTKMEAAGFKAVIDQSTPPKAIFYLTAAYTAATQLSNTNTDPFQCYEFTPKNATEKRKVANIYLPPGDDNNYSNILKKTNEGYTIVGDTNTVIPKTSASSGFEQAQPQANSIQRNKSSPGYTPQGTDFASIHSADPMYRLLKEDHEKKDDNFKPSFKLYSDGYSELHFDESKENTQFYAYLQDLLKSTPLKSTTDMDNMHGPLLKLADDNIHFKRALSKTDGLWILFDAPAPAGTQQNSASPSSESNLLGWALMKAREELLYQETLKNFSAAQSKTPLLDTSALKTAADKLCNNNPLNYREAIQKYRAAAEQGNPEALLALGDIHALRKGIPQHLPIARSIYQTLVAQKNTHALAKLTALDEDFGDGKSNKRDYKALVANYEKVLSEIKQKNDPAVVDANYRLGNICLYGLDGQSPDYAKAMTYFTAAAPYELKAASQLAYMHQEKLNSTITYHAHTPSSCYEIVASNTNRQSKDRQKAENALSHLYLDNPNNLSVTLDNAIILRTPTSITAFRKAVKTALDEKKPEENPLFTQTLKKQPWDVIKSLTDTDPAINLATLKKTLNDAGHEPPLTDSDDEKPSLPPKPFPLQQDIPKFITTIANSHPAISADEIKLGENEVNNNNLDAALTHFKNANADVNLLKLSKIYNKAGNYDKAFECCHYSALLGNVSALVEMGHLSREIKGNHINALAYYEEAYRKKDPDGAYWYGYLCQHSKQDYATAVEAYKLAAGGHPNDPITAMAAYNLGYIYEYGLNTKPSKTDPNHESLALQYYIQAYDRNDPTSLNDIHNLCSRSKDPKVIAEALRFFPHDPILQTVQQRVAPAGPTQPAIISSGLSAPTKPTIPNFDHKDQKNPISDTDINLLADDKLKLIAKLTNHFFHRSHLAYGSWSECQHAEALAKRCEQLQAALAEYTLKGGLNTDNERIIADMQKSLSYTITALNMLHKDGPRENYVFCDSHFDGKTQQTEILGKLKAITGQEYKAETVLSGNAVCGVVTDSTREALFIQRERSDNRFVSEAYIPTNPGLSTNKFRDFVIDQIESFRADPRNDGKQLFFESGFSKEHLLEATKYCNLCGYDWAISPTLHTAITSGLDKDKDKDLIDLLKGPKYDAKNDDLKAWLATNKKYPFSMLLSGHEETEAINNLKLPAIAPPVTPSPPRSKIAFDPKLYKPVSNAPSPPPPPPSNPNINIDVNPEPDGRAIVEDDEKKFQPLTDVNKIQLFKDGLAIVPFYDSDRENAIFANFYKKSLTVNGQTFASPEVYFQAQKFTVGSEAWKAVATAADSRTAFTLARDYADPTKHSDCNSYMTPGWHESKHGSEEGGAKYQAMLKVVRERYKQDNEFKTALDNTKDAYILEDTYKDPTKATKAGADAEWGGGSHGMGRNLLGKALMQVLAEEKAKSSSSAFDPVAFNKQFSEQRDKARYERLVLNVLLDQIANDRSNPQPEQNLVLREQGQKKPLAYAQICTRAGSHANINRTHTDEKAINAQIKDNIQKELAAIDSNNDIPAFDKKRYRETLENISAKIDRNEFNLSAWAGPGATPASPSP